MNWDAVGAIGEVMGAAAVVLTLIYLSIQVRQNRKLQEASLAVAQRESTNEITRLLASNRDALRVFYAGLENRDNLETLDRQQFDSIISIHFEALLQAFQQSNESVLNRSEWLVQFPGFEQWWNLYNGLYDKAFRAHMTEWFDAKRT